MCVCYVYLLAQDLKQWQQRITAKLACYNQRNMNIYLYHFRKTAGSSLRTFLKSNSQYVPFYETEGLVVNSEIVHSPLFLTFISLR